MRFFPVITPLVPAATLCFLVRCANAQQSTSDSSSRDYVSGILFSLGLAVVVLACCGYGYYKCNQTSVPEDEESARIRIIGDMRRADEWAGMTP